MNVIVWQPGSLPSFAYQEMAEGGIFENPAFPETIGPYLLSSFRSLSLTEDSEVEETLIKPDGTR